jgi:serine/threonine protein kinase
VSKFGVQRAFIQLSSQFRSLSGQQDVWDVYRREKQLGTGSFGTAYQAVNIKTHEERVIKAVARRQRVAGQ